MMKTCAMKTIMRIRVYNLLSPPTILTIKHIINFKTLIKMLVKDIFIYEENPGFKADGFGNSLVGLKMGETYCCHLLGASTAEPMKTAKGDKINANIIIAAALVNPEKPFDMEKADFQRYTVGDRAFIDAGLITAAEKTKACAQDAPFYSLSWKYKKVDGEYVLNGVGEPKKFYTSAVWGEEE